MEATGQAAKITIIKLHFFYVTLILGLGVILLITRDWTHINGFVEYLSVAAGVTSLVLGILAIIYSFVSTGTFSQSLGAIEGSATRVAKVSDELTTLLTSGQSLQTRAERRTDELHQLVVSLRTGLDALSATTSEIAGSVETIPDRIGALQKASGRDSTDESPARQSREWDMEAIERYLRKSSLFGMVGIYAAMRATAAGRYVNLKKLFGNPNHEYIWGFLIASVAAGVLEIEYPEGRRGMQAVRLKQPPSDLTEAVTRDWARRASSSTERRRTFIERYASKLDECFVDGGPDDESL